MTFDQDSLQARITSLSLGTQKIRNASSGEVVGREVRWAVEGDECPLELVAFDRWALRGALEAAKRYANTTPAVAIHVDVRCAAHTDPALELYQWLRSLGPMLADLALEIDERLIIEGVETVGAFVRAVRRLGIAVVVDHVKEAAHLEAALRGIQCDALKIDSSLTAGLDERRDAVADIVKLAHVHGMYAIADGVGDRETWESARAIGCDYVQGNMRRE